VPRIRRSGCIDRLIRACGPAFAGDRIAVATWVVDFRRIRSRRRYKFTNAATGASLVTGETEWVFVDRETGRPRAITDEVKQCFPILPGDREP